MNFRNLAAWSIRNPVVPLVLFFALSVMGIVAFLTSLVAAFTLVPSWNSTVMLADPSCVVELIVSTPAIERIEDSTRFVI